MRCVNCTGISIRQNDVMLSAGNARVLIVAHDRVNSSKQLSKLVTTLQLIMSPWYPGSCTFVVFVKWDTHARLAA